MILLWKLFFDSENFVYQFFLWGEIRCWMGDNRKKCKRYE